MRWRCRFRSCRPYWGAAVHRAAERGRRQPSRGGRCDPALWGGPETVIVISSDLSHYHPQFRARDIDDETIARIVSCDPPISTERACGAYPVNGLLDVCAERDLPVRFLGCSTSGDDDEAAFSGTGGLSARRPPMNDPYQRVVGYAAFAVWEHDEKNAGSHLCAVANPDADRRDSDDEQSSDSAESSGAGHDAGRSMRDCGQLPAGAGPILLKLARVALMNHLGIDVSEPRRQDPDAGCEESSESAAPADIVVAHPWLGEPGASFVTLREGGELRGCIGTLEAYRPLGRDVAEHAVGAAVRDPRFMPVTADEYPLIDVEVSVLSKPTAMRVRSRKELEQALRPGRDGLIIDDGRGHRATFLPQVWDDLPEPHDFVAHLLHKAGLPAGAS